MIGSLRAAIVIARRDFRAVLLSRAFVFFLLGPLFMVLVAGMAGGIGASLSGKVERAELGIALSEADGDALVAAQARLAGHLAELPELHVVEGGADGYRHDAKAAITRGESRYGAILTGSLAAPRLVGAPRYLERWEGPVAVLVADARAGATAALPDIAVEPVALRSAADRSRSRLQTAQGAQTLLFLLTILLAGMVLSNFVEEKANKIIEVLAAAVPMDAVFLGKLVAMLGISLVAVAVWGAVGGLAFFAGGAALPALTPPAVGWPMFLALGLVYFATAYLLLGALFLSIGALAATVREVQTLSMPVTMMQLLVFFLASFALGHQGEWVEIAAILFPFSSPFAMVARAAIDPSLAAHGFAILWQALWVALILRLGARLFRRTVMKSGPPQKAHGGLLARLKRA